MGGNFPKILELIFHVVLSPGQPVRTCLIQINLADSVYGCTQYLKKIVKDKYVEVFLCTVEDMDLG